MNDQAKYGTQPDRLQARYATPPKKEWVGLTDEERRSIIQLSPLAAYLHQEDWMYDRLFEIEAKLKEKNT